MATSAPTPVGFTSQIASVNSIHLHYWLGGDPHGSPVLLWHGFLSTSLEWRKVMRLLAQAGYAVLVPDMRRRDAAVFSTPVCCYGDL
jgi:alpha-beta hydrolase superfamily lysophospholipase